MRNVNQDNTKLEEWREKYRTSRDRYADELENMHKYMAQFDGSLENDKGESSKIGWNFTRELIESEVISELPQPRVKPMRPNPRTLENARRIEDMLKCEMDRLPFEFLNDRDERTAKIYGGSGFLIQWDNSDVTHDTVGAISVETRDATQIIPQYGVYELDDMDYVFVVYDVTKSFIKARYGADVEDETVDSEASDATEGDELVTQIVVYFRNKKGTIGCFSWAGDTVLIDEEEYEARKDNVCAACGRPQPYGKTECVCGANEWEKRPAEYEIIEEDITLSDGTVVPAWSPKTGDDGIPITEEEETPALDRSGLPIMGSDGKPLMQKRIRQIMEPTKIEYYYPRMFPLVIRRNKTRVGHFLGESEAGVIRGLQQYANQLMTKARQKSLKLGDIVLRVKNIKCELSDDDVTVVDVENIGEMNGLKAVHFDFVPEQEMNFISRIYGMAKSELGITDSYQGKADATATSGRAKEAQIAQSSGMQRSKAVMKNAAYANIFEMMFKFMLAYADEPRIYITRDNEGHQQESVFDRRMFLERDDAGRWYYDDSYIFSVDESGVDANNKMMMIEDLRTDYNLGAYGDPGAPETRLNYWRMKELIGYPNAKQQVQHWEEQVRQNTQMLMEQNAQLMEQNSQLAAQNEAHGRELMQISEAEKQKKIAEIQREIAAETAENADEA